MEPDELVLLIERSIVGKGDALHLHITDCLMNYSARCDMIDMPLYDFRKLTVQEYFEWSQKN